MKKLGIILFVILVFMACQKEETPLSPNTNVVTTVDSLRLPVLTGLYWGRHNESYTSPSGSTNSRTDSVYAIVDSIGVNEYRFIISADSLLTGIIYDTIDIDLQSQVLKPCSQGVEFYNQSLPGGVMHNVSLVITTCDSVYIGREYRPVSSHSGPGESFSGKKLR